MKYDLIVIGAGAAGLNVAVFMARIGLKVLMCEKHKIGGDCTNYGCIPSKSLINIAHTAHYAQQGKELGLKTTGKVNMKTVAKLIKKRKGVILKHETPEVMRKKGIDVEMGEAKFISKNSIRVNGKEHSAKKIVIATGSRPTIPPIEGIEKVKYMTNEQIFDNKVLPKRLLVIGAGPVGIELAQSYQRLGSKVTVVSRGTQILPHEEKEIAMILQGVLKKEGMDIRLGFNPVRFKGKNTLMVKKYNRETRKNTGKEISIAFDQILLATGRKLNIDNLDIEKAGIAVEKRTLIVDNYRRTTNKNVFVCGDAAGLFQFTHWAEYEAAIVIKNMLSPFKTKVNTRIVGWVTYSDPEVATFGAQLSALQKSGISFETVTMDLKDVDRSITEGIDTGLLKVYLNKKGKILGGTLIAKNAGELVGELMGAMTLNIPFSKLFNRLYPYPTLARVQRKALQKYLGKSLTPKAIRLLRILFRILN